MHVIVITPHSIHPRWTNPEQAGLIPMFLRSDDDRPAREQINDNYQHGGGWLPFGNWEIDAGNGEPENPSFLRSLTYPEDRPFREVSRCEMASASRKETLILFESGMLAIVQEDGSFEVSRVD